MTCFYHKSDLDGMCSGAIVKAFDQAVELRGIQYGEPFPWDEITPGQTVYMVDFSLQPFSDMERLNNLARLVWIDHHKTSLDEAQQAGFLASGGQNLAIDTAGCELTWGFCFPDVAMPASVFMLGRYDVWDHMNHPGSLEFQYGVRQYDTKPENQEFWQELFKSQGLTERIKQEGSLLLSYEEKQNAAYCRSCAFEVEVDGLRCIAINRGLTSSLRLWPVSDEPDSSSRTPPGPDMTGCGKRSGAGRKPGTPNKEKKPNSRGKVIHVRLSDAERAEAAFTSDCIGESFSDFVRGAIMEKCENVKNEVPCPVCEGFGEGCQLCVGTGKVKRPIADLMARIKPFPKKRR